VASGSLDDVDRIAEALASFVRATGGERGSR
jgi:hypothetical protein